MATSSKDEPVESQPDSSRRVRRQHRSSGQARREALLRAAIDVIAAKGMAGVTHRAVTDAAGVPLATVSYFFDSITELALEAIRVYTKRRIDELHQFVTEAKAQSSEPGHVARQISANRMSTRAIQVMVEVYLQAARDPDMRQPAADMLSSVDDFTTTALRASGAPEPESMARAFVALSDGYSLHSLASADQRVATDELNIAMRAMFLGYLLQQGHTDQVAEVLAQQQHNPSRRRGRKPK